MATPTLEELLGSKPRAEATPQQFGPTQQIQNEGKPSLESLLGNSSKALGEELQNRSETEDLGLLGGTARGITRIPSNFMKEFNQSQEEVLERELGTAKDLQRREARTPEVEEGLTADRLGTGLKIGAGLSVGGASSLVRGTGAAIGGAIAPTIEAIPGGETALKALGGVIDVLGSAKDSVKRQVSPEAGRDIERALDAFDVVSAIYGGAITKKAFSKIKGKVLKSVDEAGEATVKSVQSKAIKSGIPEDVANAIVEAPAPLKKEFLNIAKTAKSNIGKLVPDNLTLSAGEELTGFVKNLFDKKKVIGKDLGAANNVVSKKSVNLIPERNKFLKKLDEMKVTVGEDGKLDYSKSPRLRNNKVAQGLTDETFADLKTRKTTMGNLTEARGGMFERLGGAKAQKTIGRRDRITALLSDTHRDLGKLFPNNVQKLNKQFAELADSTGKFSKKLGIEIGDLENLVDSKTLKATELARRLGGQASSEVAGLIDNAAEIAKQHGIKAPKNLKDIVAFGQKVERITKETAPTSFKGQIEGAAKQLGSQIERKGLIAGTTAGTFDAIKRILGSGKKTEIDAIINLLEGKIKPSKTSRIIESTSKTLTK